MSTGILEPTNGNENRVVELVIAEGSFTQIETSVAAYSPLEDFCFIYSRIVRLPQRTLLLAGALCLLDDNEAERTPYSVAPTIDVTQAVYGGYVADKMNEDKIVLVSVHSHPFSTSHVELSGIDYATIAEDRRRWNKLVPEGVTFAWLVVGAGCRHFDGVLVTPEEVLPIEQITVVGSTLTVMRRSAPAIRATAHCTAPSSSRTRWRARR